MTYQIRLLALPDCAGSSLFGMIDFFQAANRIVARVSGQDRMFELKTISETGSAVVCAGAQSMAVDGSLEQAVPADILIVPAFVVEDEAGIDQLLAANRQIINWLAANASSFELLASCCSGGFLLAEAGALRGRDATTSWWLAESFARRYPDINLNVDLIVAQAGEVMTGAASTAWQDVALAIIEKKAGKHVARLVAKYMLVDNQRRSQMAYAILSQHAIKDPMVKQAEQWVRKHLETHFSIEEVAKVVGVSPRTLIRRFQKELGSTPQGFVQMLRIEKSKMLLETTQLSLDKILDRCGYSDESAFRRVFTRLCDLSPNEYRRRFNATNHKSKQA
jgi:transcriptional regulator GlxA family with amidase domain